MASETGWVQRIERHKIADWVADIKQRNIIIMTGIPPNILVIMTDQQRWDSPGCYGFQGADTPNLDRLARKERYLLFEMIYRKYSKIIIDSMLI
jgi:hypothetical protein